MSKMENHFIRLDPGEEWEEYGRPSLEGRQGPDQDQPYKLS